MSEFPLSPWSHLKRSKAHFAKIEELALAALWTQTASIFTLRFAKNAESNEPKMDSLGKSDTLQVLKLNVVLTIKITHQEKNLTNNMPLY